jgi:hypothetical protein
MADAHNSSSHHAPRWTLVLAVLAAALAVWALVVAASGGLSLDLGFLRISSRNPVRPALIALTLITTAWWLGVREWLDIVVHRLDAMVGVLQPAAVALLTAAVLTLGIVYGTRAAGGSDSQGYISQSWLWLHGTLRLDHRFGLQMPWPDAPGTLAPLGYRTRDGEVLVPTYAPGLPLLMAVSRLFSSCGPYLVSVVCGSMLVIVTYLLGRKYFSGAAGLVAAVLTATSPTIFYMSLSPMADLPSATFWLSALVTAGRSVRRALAAGVLAGVAVVIRPNLVPLALFPWLLCVIRSAAVRPITVPTVLYGAGILPFVALVGWVNYHLYGSPFESGYAALSPMFRVAYGASNIVNYTLWWVQSQSILAAIFVLAVFKRHPPHRREAVVLMAFGVSVLLAYLFYLPFDVWWFLRFLIPAMPIAFLFCADVIEWGTSRLPRTARFAALAAFTFVSVVYTAHFSRQMSILESSEVEQKYVDAGVFVDRATPPEAVVISMQHSGSIRYYSGRLTLRYDLLDPAWLDRAISTLGTLGRPVYLLLDDWEEAPFRARHIGTRALDQLSAEPAATSRSGTLRFYALNGAPVLVTSKRIPHISRFQCPDISPRFATAGQPTAALPLHRP